MNRLRVVSGGVILSVGALGALLSLPVLLAGDTAVLPITILGAGAMALGAMQLRAGLRASAPRRGPRRVPGPRRRHADTSVPLMYYGDPGGGDRSDGGSGSDGGDRSDGGSGDSGGGFFGGDSGGGGFFGGGGDSGGGFSGGGGDSGGGGGGS
ncbi:hypothetical protein [Micromonospora sp. NPDC005174]|uniref:hypothetical protein n=1 Tax=Micromonospora sp. NPDC005174 TaxID=3157018 RepID=UPI0033A0FE25